MSYFLFGSFDSTYDEELAKNVKIYADNKNIYFWFGKEITFYKDIQRMFEEQKSKGNIKFAITSKNQPRNSSDVLFPFDKYESNLLFEDESRDFYKRCCRENIDILFDCLKKMIDKFHIKQADIFVVEGYDDVFMHKTCSVNELKQDLLCQIEDKVSIDSYIYRVIC